MDIDVHRAGRLCKWAAGWRGAGAGRPRQSVARRMVAGLAVLLLLSASSSAMAQGVAGGRRVALVVGNDAYRAQSALQNAVNDARAVAAALGELDFAVTRVENADRARLTSALSEFAGSLRGDDVALFYFAGHGVQVGQENYLMPTDYAGQTASALRFDAVSASDVQEMLRPARVAMLVFDACRNNPYRGVRGGTGLAPMEARGTLIAYAAGAGEVAADAAPGASNGLFTAKFVEALAEPRLTASALFMRVRREVVAASNEEQWPAVYNDLLSDFVFRPAAAAAGGPSGGPAAVVAAPAAVAAALQQETVFWESIRESTDSADFEAYLELFANGTFARLARNRLAAMRGLGDAPRPGADPARPGVRDGEMFRDCPDCPELVVIPASEFWMGSPTSEEGRYADEGPQREVRVERFALGRYEVTFEEYERFAVARGRDPRGRPVINVSWEDAMAYAAWLSGTGFRYRLPSEAEWEYAARAGTETRYSWGNAIGRNRANCTGCGSRWGETVPVGSFAANAWGLHDMHGNVSEWVEDCWQDNYWGVPSDGRAWTSGGDCSRVARGGSWNHFPRLLRAANRIRLDAGYRNDSVGFRVARTLD